jgi:hypothetical protein
MAALGLDRFFAEVSQNVRHAFTAPEDGTSPTKVKGSHYNAAHLAPDIEMGANAGTYVAVVAAGELFTAPSNRWQKRLAQATAVRIQATVNEAAAGKTLGLEYTTDLTGASGWTTMSVSVSVAATGNVVSSWVAVPALAIAEANGVLLRWVLA